MQMSMGLPGSQSVLLIVFSKVTGILHWHASAHTSLKQWRYYVRLYTSHTYFVVHCRVRSRKCSVLSECSSLIFGSAELSVGEKLLYFSKREQLNRPQHSLWHGISQELLHAVWASMLTESISMLNVELNWKHSFMCFNRKRFKRALWKSLSCYFVIPEVRNVNP